METIRSPNWEKWRYVPNVRLWEGVALSLNVEPGKVRHSDGSWMADTHLFNEPQDFQDRMFVAERNITTNKLLKVTGIVIGDPRDSSVTLSSFALWASSIGWEIPQELTEMSQSARVLDLEKDNPVKAPANPDIGTRERETVIRIIAGFLAQGFKPADISQPYKIAKDIREALESCGIELSDDTIAKWVKEGAALINGQKNRGKS